MIRRGYEQRTSYTLATYGPDRDPHFASQKAFFSGAVREAAERELTQTPVIKKGPYFDDFSRVMQAVGLELAMLNERFTPEYLAPASYQSKEVKADIQRQSATINRQLTLLKQRRIDMLNGITEIISPKLGAQSIPAGLLNTPAYRRTQEGWESIEAIRGCSNACFRMVFGAITGLSPSQAAVSECLVEQYGTSIVEESVYAGLYQTDAFKDKFDRRVLTVDIIGADFDVINTLATKIKQPSRPDAQVFCTLSIASATAGQDVLHTVVLLEADGENVRCHDPNYDTGGPNTIVPYDVFARRWTRGYNRAQLTIATAQ